jgi:hypothetical protein
VTSFIYDPVFTTSHLFNFSNVINSSSEKVITTEDVTSGVKSVIGKVLKKVPEQLRNERVKHISIGKKFSRPIFFELSTTQFFFKSKLDHSSF